MSAYEYILVTVLTIWLVVINVLARGKYEQQ